MSSEYSSLDDVADVIDSLHKTPSYFAHGFPMVRVTDVKYGNLHLGNTFRVDESTYLEFSRRYKPRAGDIIITRVGTYGVSAKVADTMFCLGQNTAAIVPKSINSRYLYAALNSDFVRSQIESGVVGSTQKTLSLKNIKALKIPRLEDKDEEEMAEVIGALDDRIALLRETNATLEAIAQALFKSWFVDFDPVRAKMEGRVPEGMDEVTAALFPDGFEESELGVVPMGWRVDAVGKVVEGIYDGPHATPSEAEHGPIFLGIKNLTGTGLDLREVRHIHEDDWAQWTRRITPRQGDIVFSYEATLAFFALIPPETRCCLGRRLALIRPSQINGVGYFWFHQFIAAPFQRLLDKHTIHGATVNRIALKAFPSFLVLNPPIALKTVFDGRVAPLWAKIHENQVQAQTLATLRDTLLPRLISGQLRLPVPA